MSKVWRLNQAQPVVDVDDYVIDAQEGPEQPVGSQPAQQQKRKRRRISRLFQALALAAGLYAVCVALIVAVGNAVILASLITGVVFCIEYVFVVALAARLGKL